MPASIASDDDRRPTAKAPLICHVIYRLEYGGLENGLVNLINELPDGAYRHAIVCLTGVTDFSKRILRSDVQLLELRKRPGKDFGAYQRFWQMVRQLRPNVVHTRNRPTIDMLAVAAVAGVRRLVHGEHGLDVDEIDGTRMRYRHLRRLSRLVVDRYVEVSDDLADWLNRENGIPRQRIDLISNGVDTRRFTPGAPPRERFPGARIPDGAFIPELQSRIDEIEQRLGR